MSCWWILVRSITKVPLRWLYASMCKEELWWFQRASTQRGSNTTSRWFSHFHLMILFMFYATSTLMLLVSTNYVFWQIFDFALTEEEMKAIEALNKNIRFVELKMQVHFNRQILYQFWNIKLNLIFCFKQVEWPSRVSLPWWLLVWISN